MTNIGMAMDTRQDFVLFRVPGVSLNRQQRMHEVFVAADTSTLCNYLVARFDLDRLVVVLECKGD